MIHFTLLTFDPEKKRRDIMMIPIKHIQLNVVLKLFKCYKEIKSHDCYGENDVHDSFFLVVCYVVRYFNVQKVNAIDF